MKKTEIVVGKKYTDGKDAVREVLSLGEHVLYAGQADRDGVQYRVVAKKKGPRRIGEICNTTLVSFASWAKAEVP